MRVLVYCALTISQQHITMISYSSSLFTFEFACFFLLASSQLVQCYLNPNLASITTTHHHVNKKRAFSNNIVQNKEQLRSSLLLVVHSTRTKHDPILGNKDENNYITFDNIAHKLKLQVYNLEEGLYGLDSKDETYGIEVIRTEIKCEPLLGLELLEMASGPDGQGLVLVSAVCGNAALSPIRIGDIIVGVSVVGTSFAESTVGFDWENTVDTIQRARSLGKGSIVIEVNRLVERAKVVVNVKGPVSDIPNGSVNIEALAGENLRRLLLRKGIKLYDRKTKRFDMPYATGDCAGEGLCGTCLVQVNKGMDLLSPKHGDESLITKGRPDSWRASCRTVVGADNKEGILQIQIHPQSQFEDELNPGTKSLDIP